VCAARTASPDLTERRRPAPRHKGDRGSDNSNDHGVKRSPNGLWCPWGRRWPQRKRARAAARGCRDPTCLGQAVQTLPRCVVGVHVAGVQIPWVDVGRIDRLGRHTTSRVPVRVTFARTQAVARPKPWWMKSGVGVRACHRSREDRSPGPLDTNSFSSPGKG